MSNILSASSRIIIVIRRRLVTCNRDLVIVEDMHIIVSESWFHLLIIFIKSLVKNHYWYSPRRSIFLLKQEREWVETDQPITSVNFVTDVKLIFYIFTFDDHRCDQITSYSCALLITLMTIDHRCGCSMGNAYNRVHHLLQKWWKKVEQSWQLSGWISTPLCVVVGISIQLSDLIHYEQLTSTTLILSSACSRSSSWWSALTFPELAASMSIILPGVHTMISAPRFNSAICSEIPVPPVNLHHDDEDEYVERILWGWWRQLELHPQSTSKSSHWEWKHRGSKNQRSSELSASMVHPSYWEPRMILKGWQIDDRWQIGWSLIKRP